MTAAAVDPADEAGRDEPLAVLLDGNVLVALVDEAHVHHLQARAWFAQSAAPFATCPITQGTLVRLMMRVGGMDAGGAMTVMAGLTRHPRHRFWPDDLPYEGVRWNGVFGHRQVTDAYLAALARMRGGRLATFDRGLAALHPDVAVLVGNA